MCSERVQSDELKLTPEALSRIFAARWTILSAAANALLTEGLIEYCHGSIRIVDRRGLEGVACDCYRAIDEEFDQLHYQY
jgi:hypothetical protein